MKQRTYTFEEAEKRLRYPRVEYNKSTMSGYTIRIRFNERDYGDLNPENARKIIKELQEMLEDLK